MNSNRRVLLFVLSSVLILLMTSLAGYFFGFNWTPFNRVNLISDLVVKPADSTVIQEDTTGMTLPPIVIEKKPYEDFALYQRAHFITNFHSDTTSSSLQNFVKKLYELKSGKKTKVRIAYFGDSMIEGDLLTQTLRRELQKTFGGYGVGFVPITSPVSKFRQTAIADYSNGWEDENFKVGKSSKLFLSGHLFRTKGDWVQITDRTIAPDSVNLEKSLLCGSVIQRVPVSVNNRTFNVETIGQFNRIVLGNDKTTRIKLSIDDEKLPVYGISFESEFGVFVDNFSFRGITGIEFARIDSAFLQSIADNNPYDLIIFQYGVNLLWRPNDNNFNWYSKAMVPIINKFKNCFLGSDFLVVSTTDRAFSYKGEYKSAIGIDSLIRIQALLAYQTGSVFYNQFETMGGTNSIVEWAKMKPSLANKDYVHPNHRGAEILGNYFFSAILNDYDKYVKSLNN
jgi:hypothetical protein